MAASIVGCLTCSTNPSLHREKVGVGSCFPIVKHCAGGGIYGERVCFSYPFQCGHFLKSLTCRRQSTSFWISLRRNQSMCNCIVSASMGGRKVMTFLCYHLGDNRGGCMEISPLSTQSVKAKGTQGLPSTEILAREREKQSGAIL